jgi:hypothetical protein
MRAQPHPTSAELPIELKLDEVLPSKDSTCDATRLKRHRGVSPMDKKGRPTRAGHVLRQAGAVATAVQTDKGLHWEVRRERDGLVRVTKCLADTSHWSNS